MNAFHRIVVLIVVALTVSLVLPEGASAQSGRWVREFYGHYFTREDAASVARAINRSGDPNFRNATYEHSPNPVTRTFGVYVERFRPDAVTSSPAAASVRGAITAFDSFDRVRHNCRAKVYQYRMSAGRSYTIDLMSGNGHSGPGFFDTYLRIENSRGIQVAANDDGGEGLNSRLVFNPPRDDNYRLIVTTYRAGATGSFRLTIR